MATATTTQNWTVDKLPDLTGKTYFITGGNSGIGYQSAVHLRRANADVIIGARSPEKGAAAVQLITAFDGGGLVDMVAIDLADTASIREANLALRGLTDGIDAMINNAGVMQMPQEKTVDGFERQFGTNHLGHFLLNHLVFDLVAARGGRVVPVSSIAHRMAKRIDFDDPMLDNSYSPTGAYGQSKLANLLYGLEPARRLDAAGSGVISASAHPGYSATNLQSSGPTGFFRQLYKLTNIVMAQSAANGALPIVLAAAGSEARNGGYYGPTRFGETRGPAGDSRIADVAKDPAEASQLWSMSENLLSITFTVA